MDNAEIFRGEKKGASTDDDGRTEADGRENENERANAVTDGCGAVIAR